MKLNSKKNENKLLEFDQLTWIPYLIKRHDRIGMNYGLEVRPPFLDHKLVEFMNALPVEYKFTSSSNKIFFKKIEPGRIFAASKKSLIWKLIAQQK